MTGSSKLPRLVPFRRAAWAALLVLAATLVPFALPVAAAAITLQVQAATGLPGFHRGDLQRYMALHMAEVGVDEWRFEPAADSGPARDRVEWTFKFKPNLRGRRGKTICSV